jgi:hypothetical protein
MALAWCPSWLFGDRGGLLSIEQTFYSGIAQHDAIPSRLTAVEIDPRSLAAALTRTAAMLLIAVLLILVLLPAALAANSR